MSLYSFVNRPPQLNRNQCVTISSDSGSNALGSVVRNIATVGINVLLQVHLLMLQIHCYFVFDYMFQQNYECIYICRQHLLNDLSNDALNTRPLVYSIQNKNTNQQLKLFWHWLLLYT